MGTLTDYFLANRYRGKYQIGDRVYGLYHKIPFIGTVGIDRVVNETDGPEVTVFVDLPLKYEGTFRNIIVVKHKDIKQLLTDYENTGLSRTSKK